MDREENLHGGKTNIKEKNIVNMHENCVPACEWCVY